MLVIQLEVQVFSDTFQALVSSIVRLQSVLVQKSLLGTGIVVSNVLLIKLALFNEHLYKADTLLKRYGHQSWSLPFFILSGVSL